MQTFHMICLFTLKFIFSQMAKLDYGSKVFVTTGIWDVRQIIGFDDINNIM